MNYLLKCKLFLYFLLSSFAFTTYAFSFDNSQSLLENKTACLAVPYLCINQIDQQIDSVKRHSTSWYGLINFKLLAIWEIRDTKWLKKEVHQYAHLHDAPPIFLTTVYTLYAKMLFSDGLIEEGNNYANKAITLIKEVNDVSFDADRYAEVIILYIQFNQYEDVEKFITWINNRTEKMGPPQYFPKLQTAIAHKYFNFSDYDLALKHYQYALTGFIEIDYLLETAEGYHNLARALQGKEEYKEAITAFKKALKWMVPAEKEGKYSIEAKNYTQLRLIETLHKSGQIMQAKAFLAEVKSNQVDKGNLPLYQLLKANLLDN